MLTIQAAVMVLMGSAMPVWGAVSTWTNPNGGSWATAGNWAGGLSGDGASNTADFGTLNLTADTTVALDGARTIGTLVFGDSVPSHNWTLATGSAGPLTTGNIRVTNQTATISAVLAGTESLTKTGSGTLDLTALNTYTGITTVEEGTLRLSANSGASGTLASPFLRIQAGAAVTASVANALGRSGTNWLRTVEVNNASFTTTANGDQGWGVEYVVRGATLTASGTGARFAAGGGTTVTAFSGQPQPSVINGEFRLREGNPNNQVVFSSYAELVVNGPITQQAAGYGIYKGGEGSLELKGANTYTGATVVYLGTLRITGSLAVTPVTVANRAAVVVNGTLGGTCEVASGAQLIGSGTIQGATSVGGLLAPGDTGIGTLRINNSLALAATTMTQMELRRSGGVLQSDRVQGITSLTMGGTLSVSLQEGSEPLAAGDSFTLFSATSRGGSFATVELPQLTGALKWDASQLASQGRITVAKGTQTINLAAPPEIAAGDPPVTLSATASSGLPVSFTSSDPAIASVSGSLLTARAQGRVTLTASQAGDAFYLPAPPVTREVVVLSAAKAAQTITFANPGDQTTGVTPAPLVASASSGLPVSFTSSDAAVAVVENGHLVLRAPGITVLTATQAGNALFEPAPPVSYQIRVAEGTLVLPKSVARTAAVGSASFVVEVPVLSGTAAELPWTAGTTEFPSWLKVLTETGTTPGTLRLEFGTSNLAPGPHSATVVLEAGTSAFNLPVTFTVESSTPSEMFEFSQATAIPVTANGYTAAGKDAFFGLRFAPVPGTKLTVIRNTGSLPIQGKFGNLAQGQAVTLFYQGVPYRFVANYGGGTGNDLTLHWANVKAYAWGYNAYGELGNGGNVGSFAPTPVTATGVLAGKTIIALATGAYHSLALCADGSLAAWGYNNYGQLGDTTTTSRAEPVPVITEGVLGGKTIIAIAAGTSHSLALCADGTLAAWGYNGNGQLGDGTSVNRSVPVLVTTGSGALMGKTVTAIAASNYHSLALCADGTLATWGYNFQGQLGNGGNLDSLIPVAVTKPTGVLAGRTAIAIAAGFAHNLVLCSDGALAAWGEGMSGELGNGLIYSSNVPVLVNRTTGALAGKQVTMIAAGRYHNLVLCADGTLAAWGAGGSGQLGTDSSYNSSTPVAVTVSGVLAGKTLVAIGAGSNHSLGLCADGTLAAWGTNASGQLGNYRASMSLVPVAVAAGGMGGGDRFSLLPQGSAAMFSLALAAVPVSGNSALATVTLNPGFLTTAITAGHTAYTARVPHGTTAVTLTPVPADATATLTVNGVPLAAGATSPALPLAAGPTPITVVVTAPDRVSRTTYQINVGNDATLAGLTLSAGILSPVFAADGLSYRAEVPPATAAVTLTPTATDATATIRINGSAVTSGAASGPLDLVPGHNPVAVTVTALDGTTTGYQIDVIRQTPLTFTYATDRDIPVTAVGYIAAGNTVALGLDFAPVTGSSLTVVNNTGSQPLGGRFANLAHGQIITLRYRNANYRLVANYYGGTGNDLVLQWAATKAYAWGRNANGELGNGTLIDANLPVAVVATGVLAGKCLTGIAAGQSHNVVMNADGSLASWGYQFYGSLGNGNSDPKVPATVLATGALADKKVAAIALGSGNNLALCTDGTLAIWGQESSSSGNTTPVAVPLAGKIPTAIAAGDEYRLVLCADGSLVAWGNNGSGQLGTGNRTSATTPQPVIATTGALAGKTVIAIAAGGRHSLALCADGTVAAWGENGAGELGDGTNLNSVIPVAVATTGVLAGKTVTAISAGANHSLALCADGTLVAWGDGSGGQLGNGSNANSNAPVTVTRSGVLAGRTLSAICAGSRCSFALCTDGRLTTWGYSNYGKLGVGSSPSDSNVPIAVATSPLAAGEKFAGLPARNGAGHTLALVGMPLAGNSTLAALALTPGALTAPLAPGTTAYTARVLHGATSLTVTPTLADANASVTVNGTPVAPGTASPAIALGAGSNVINLTVTAEDGVATTSYQVTVRDDATLSGLALSAGELTPAFSATTTSYAVHVPSATAALTVTPTATDSAATITVNGTPVASGAASGSLALAFGANPTAVVVTALDGTATTYQLSVIRQASLAFTYLAATAAAATAADYTATGNTVELALGFAPIPGTRLPVVNNTGAGPIVGRFDNLAQGQVIVLPFGNASYRFVANYYGGTGNDLMLLWAGQTIHTWGNSVKVPTALNSGALAGKVIVALTAGRLHNLALCADGTLAAWGDNSYGQLGNGTTTTSAVPVAVTTTGVLAGKTVTSIAAGGNHCLALCTDGTLVAWGYNTYGQLGNNSTTNSSVPVAVTTTGVLAGKTITAIAAGDKTGLVLCSDGTLADWGLNSVGQLGNNSTTSSNVPVAVIASGVLAGKTVVAIATGQAHSLVLCADGTLVTWGHNDYSQLGNGSTSNSGVPVKVTSTGVLAGKTVTFIGVGGNHNLVYCADRTLVAWGYNPTGQLGNGTTTSSSVPVLVTTAGSPLAGKTITALGGGAGHSLALCADGTLAAWGDNSSGQLGNNSTTNSSVPVAVVTSGLASGARFIALATGAHATNSSTALVAFPLSNNSALAGLTTNPGVLDPTFAAGTTAYTARVLHGTPAVTVTPTVADAFASVTVNGATVASGAASPAIARLPGNPPIGVKVTAQDGTSTSYAISVKDDSTLAGFSLSVGSLAPVLSPTTTSYTSHVAAATTAVSVTPIATDPTASITVNGRPVSSEATSEPVTLTVGANPIAVTVTALDGTVTTYQITVARPGPVDFTYTAGTDVPVTGVGYTATGNTANLALGFTPAGPVNLTVVNNTGWFAIGGRFDNLAQGQTVNFTRNGLTYSFVADYYGGTGNDLVLRWANNKAYAWGYNTNGQLGNGTTTTSSLPVAVTNSGVLAGRAITALARGSFHSLALCADGTLAAWGSNAYGQLGTGNTTASTVPVAVVTTGALAGKQVIAITAGFYHNLALCADGTVVGWGRSDYGQIGVSDSTVPVVMPATGALAGKAVIAIAAGSLHSLALCADGSIAGWGWNTNGQLGNGRNDNVVRYPVAVTTTGALAGKTPIAIAAGYAHSLALAADGTVAAWGDNTKGQLGNGSTTTSSVPVAVTATGVLAGKTITAISAGYDHILVRCADGSLVAWGANSYGQLGNNSTTSSPVPVAVTTTGILAGKTITAIAAGDYFNSALCTDGTLAAWGYNNSGQLGNGTSTNSNVPVAVTTTGLGSGEKFNLLSAGPGASHMLALAATPLSGNSALAGLALDTGTLSPAFAPGLTTYLARVTHGTVAIRVTPTTADTHSTVTVNGTVVASGAASPPLALSPGNQTLTLKVTAQDGTATTYLVTVQDDSTLSGLALSAGTLSPAFAADTTAYAAYVSNQTATVAVTLTANDPSAMLTVNGAAVASGAASDPLALTAGSNTITVRDTALDGTLTTYTLTIIRQVPLTAAFASATTVPATAVGYTATASTVNLSLTYAPTTGTRLTVVNNTGPNAIQGRFTNLAQGQMVTLVFNNVSYRFVANYYGGTGNDLVLHWADVKAYTWGNNYYGQLGTGGTANSSLPGPVTTSGVLAGKTIVTLAAGASHAVALCADGTLAAWGNNDYGQLGNGTTTGSSVPVAVNTTGVLAGKTVVAISVGTYNNLAVCADGMLVAWGRNDSGQLGIGTTTTSTVPMAVTSTGILAGKTIGTIAAGGSFGLALCTDGTLAAWGGNNVGQLGNGTTTDSTVPVAVTTGSGLLAGKTISAIATGSGHSLVLCTDGTLATWGYNYDGQLGNNSTTNSSLPVAVTTTGVLSGKTVTAIAAGTYHSLVRCSDGTLASWGSNGYKQLGTGNSSSSSVPAAVVITGVLAGKTVTALSTGYSQNVVRCSDGTLVTWGRNGDGQLGNGTTTDSSVPVTVSTTTLGAGEIFMAGAAGQSSSHTIGLTAVPVSTNSKLAALTLGSASLTTPFAPATLTYTARLTRAVTTVTVTPTAVDASSVITVNGTVLPSGATSQEITRVPGTPTTITIKVTAQNGTSTTYTVTLADDATLAGLDLSTGPPSPAFASDTTSYVTYVSTATVTVTPTATDPTAAITVNTVAVASGSASNPLSLVPGTNAFTVKVTALDGSTTSYVVSVIRQVPLTYTFAAATGVAATTASYTATGNTVNLTLNFAPPAGTNLTVVNNTGTAPIQGAFTNLAQGQLVQLTYGGVTYAFVANYYGGTGNDLVLQWANTRLLAWGGNSFGELGNNSTTQSILAVPVDRSGVLAGKTIIRISAGVWFSLALCADGTLAAWGINEYGRLGDNSSTTRNTPVAVVQTGALADKTVTAIATGDYHCLALCSDGTLVGWGQGNAGQLGNGGYESRVPLLISQRGTFVGKTIIAIAAGGNHSLALCADGTLAAWGDNYDGQVGDGTTTRRMLPVLVDRTGVLLGKTVTAIAAGDSHCLALCSDGTLAAWGSTTSSSVPVLVARTGTLAGKTVTALSAGDNYSLALCSNSTVAAWGSNSYGQLGNGSTSSSTISVAVTATGVLAGKTVQGIWAGTSHSLAVCSDGTLTSWGANSNGQLGNSTTTDSSVPVTVTRNGMATAERFVAAAVGSTHTLALVAAPPVPLAVSAAATAIVDTGTTLNGTVNAQGNSTAVSFEYGLTTAYGTTVAATPATVTGTATTATSAAISALPAGTTYHFRVVAANAGGTVRGDDLTFTTTAAATLVDLSLDPGTLNPGFANLTTAYFATVPFGTPSLTVTPTCTDPAATVTVNGGAVASGTASAPQSLLVGNNLLTVSVTAAGGGNQQSYAVMATRLPETLTFPAATTVPIASANFAATGILPPVTLAFAPPAGTTLTLVNNTGTGAIQGTFTNLAQGQAVTLTYAGVSYPFVSNYFGGTGNDLVLQWANTRLLAWGGGATNYGQLGNGKLTNSPVPVPVDRAGVLAGKTILAAVAGNSHGLALCADGDLATWGYNYYGQLGNGTTTSSSVPVLVTRTGVLADRKVIAIAAGVDHCLALCADGTLVSWGYNWAGQLGNNSTNHSSLPVLVNQTGVLAGRKIVAIWAGNNASFALCADGALAVWGYNYYGQLGDGTTTNRSVPALLNQTGVLAGKTIKAIAPGLGHTLCWCADGTLAAWGSNNSGQLGNITTTNSSLPVLVSQAGVLAGKTVAGIAAAGYHSFAICTDGTVAAWGSNSSGQLGDNSTTNRTAPILVVRTGVLAGKTVTDLSGGDAHSAAVCADNTLAAWGDNANGQLGDGTTAGKSVPTLVNSSALGAGERVVDLSCGTSHNLALVASPPPPAATTLAATNLLDTSATLNGTVMANGQATAVSFEYGLTAAYGSVISASPATILGTTVTPVSATPTGLLAATTYHYRVVAGPVRGDDLTFTTTGLATLASLTLDSGTLSPGFASQIPNYAATVPFAAATITLMPVTAAADATVTVAGTPVAAGAVSQPVALAVGNNRIEVVVTAPGGTPSTTYAVTVARLPEVFAFDSVTTVPVTANELLATGQTATLALNFAPQPGTSLTVVNNTGSNPIQGTFANLLQNQAVSLTFAGITYPFVANYSGGTGNDLVLQWGNTRVLAWGYNSKGQLGNGNTTSSLVPGPVITTGVLAGQTILATAAGGSHSLALCADGSVTAWGFNTYGQLGTNSYTSVSEPVLVDRTGVLKGKTVTAIAAGNSHSLALCADGTLAAWGYGSYGQLGNGSTNSSNLVPRTVIRSGVLAGKTVINIAAGDSHCLALCADGTLVAWGSNSYGQLGDGTTTTRTAPVLVTTTGVLAGKTVIAVAAGESHSLALCTDGTLAAWGSSDNGQLGNNSTTTSTVPVLVDRTGVLAGKVVTTIATGASHCLASCADGTLAAWGYNSTGQLGNGTTTSSRVPVLVTQTGILAGKTVVGLNGGSSHSFALCASGEMATWGSNNSGQLGNNSTTNSSVPGWTNTTGMKTGERFMAASGSSAHSLALTALPPPPAASTLAASAITDASATLNANVNAQGGSAAVIFEYGLTTAYGTVAAATPGTATGSAATPASATITGLLSGTTYHYRVIATGDLGTARGDDLMFTTTTAATLAELGLNPGSLSPALAGVTTHYLATVPNSATTTTLTPVTADPSATLTVNGNAVASGTASAPINLAVGENTLTVAVTAADGVNAKTYTVTVTRLPATFVFDSATTVPLTVGDFLAMGTAPDFALNFAPPPATTLTVVKNTGFGAIRGRFTNLAQGQLVPLTYQGLTRHFIANYYGGSGNDLVLQPANTRLLAWGNNGTGQLGNGSTTASSVPVPVDRSGVLAGKTIVAIVNGGDGFVGHGNCVALCADGTLAAWGSGERGQLGNGTTTDSKVPVAVDQTGVLAGKTVVSISAGASHLIVLCADGTVATWGYNMWGALGNNSLNNSPVPVLVNTAGVLAGKTVIAVAAGSYHSLALCADGTLAAWGNGSYGRLGNNTSSDSKVPVAVDQSGVLAGKAVVAIAAGGAHSLALCADGTLAAWGYNASSQLGNNLTTTSLVPTLVDRSGVLANRTITSIAAGASHSLALCSDGTVAAWGDNGSGQVGTLTPGYVPDLVDRSGALSGKTVVGIAGGGLHSLAVCSDGTMVAWGSNGYGQLGNNSIINSVVPVTVDQSALGDGESFIMGGRGQSGDFSLGLTSVPMPTAATLPASGISGTAAILNGSVNANGNATTVAFEFGLGETYGTSLAAVPDALTGGGATLVSATIGGLLPGTTYHYRVVAAYQGWWFRGADMTFTTLSDNAWLAGLGHNGGTIAPGFEKQRFEYLSSVPFDTTAVTVNAVTDHPGATFTVNGGDPATPVALTVGNNRIVVVATAEDGIATKTYAITVNRLPLEFVFNSASDIPLTSDGLAAGGNPVRMVLGFAPAPGTVLTMVNNTGLGFIYGRFGNLAQGQRVSLSFDGRNYDFIANYHGGTGNDLVLQWANTQLLAWGGNGFGQLGDASTERRLVPTPVNASGVLADKTVLAVAGGYLHSLALCADGTLAAWGYNAFGQLGNSGSVSSSIPVAVDRTGVLAGKSVVAISAGPFHNLALCSDGTLAAWGYNNYGQLGTGTKETSRVPVLVHPAGALAGRQVVAVAAAAYHSFALCADGTVAAWGFNDDGELGDGSTTSSLVPMAVNLFGALAGKQIAALAAGQYHTLALCTDGTLAAWGYNNRGQLGNDSIVSSKVPVAIGSFGALAGKTVVAARANGAHSLALCSDGTLAAWGWNRYGQLGVTDIPQSAIPVAIDPGSGRTPGHIAIGGSHSLVRFTDGTMAAWGDNSNGQLGNHTTTPSLVPVAVDMSSLDVGARVMFEAGGAAALHNLAVVGLPSARLTQREATIDDSDHDGVPDLIEYAFGLHLDPEHAGHLPQAERIGDRIVLRFSQPAGVTDIIYGAEWSTTLQPGSWIEVPDTGTGGQHFFSVPVNAAPSIFMRLKVARR